MSLEPRDHYHAVLLPEVKLGFVQSANGIQFGKDNLWAPDFAVSVASLMNIAYKRGFRDAQSTANTLNLGEHYGGERSNHN